MTTASSSPSDLQPPEASLRVSDVEKRYGDFTAVRGLGFEVGQREFVSVVGPSGAGKSTMLRCCAGLLPITSGRVDIMGRPVDGGPPPNLMVVFQDYSRSLFPWLSVGGNITIALRDRGLSRDEAQRRADQVLEDVGLGGKGRMHLWELSGGMQQRVAIARALALDPDVLLLDEPFGSVDAQTRESLEDLVLDIWDKTHLSVLLVTHDIDEAVYMSDRVLVTTPAPLRIWEEVVVPLPRPREQIETKTTTEYGQARAAVERALRSGIATAQGPPEESTRPATSAAH